MFVGEMGCWLVVGAMALHARWQARRRRNTGYEAVASSANHDMAAPLTAGYDDEDDELGPGAVEPAVVAPSLADEVLEDVASIHHQHRGVNVLRGARVVLLALPAICDICATTLMNVGLLLIAASIWQMTRGALVLFVGLFSVVFLRRRLYAYQWLSLVGVVLGVGLVGLAGAIWPDRQTPHSSAVAVPAAAGHHAALADAAMALMARAAGAAGVAATDSNGMLQAIVGVLLVAFAQIFTATQFVLEEWILEKSSLEPIKVTGWEGVFGFLVTIVGMCILHLAVGRTPQGRYGYFDMTEGLRQMTQNRQVLISSFAIMVSIG